MFLDKILIVIIFTFYVFYTKRTHRIIIVKKEHIVVMTTFHVYVVFAYLKINPIRHPCT